MGMGRKILPEYLVSFKHTKKLSEVGIIGLFESSSFKKLWTVDENWRVGLHHWEAKHPESSIPFVLNVRSEFEYEDKNLDYFKKTQDAVKSPDKNVRNGVPNFFLNSSNGESSPIGTLKKIRSS